MIKIRSIILSFFLICDGIVLNSKVMAQNEPVNQTSVSEYFKKITPVLLYGYADFNFNSISGKNFNKYNGHTNLYSTGADNVFLGKTMLAGVYYFGIDTKVNSEFLLMPGAVTTSKQSIHNNTIFGHILKSITPAFYADLAGGYGYNKVSAITHIAIVPTPLVAQANNNNDDWFASFNVVYRKPWKQFLWRANVGVLYSKIESGSYEYIFLTENSTQIVPSFANRATLILENAELGYLINPKFMPFISAGLIQVAQFSNSRPLVNSASIINGSLPQLILNKNGFRVGGGFVCSYKNLTMRLEEKYYNAGKIFQSYQTLAVLEYKF